MVGILEMTHVIDILYLPETEIKGLFEFQGLVFKADLYHHGILGYLNLISIGIKTEVLLAAYIVVTAIILRKKRIPKIIKQQ